WGITGRLPIASGARGRPGVLVLIFVCAFVLYVGIENGTGGWMTSHLESTGLQSAQAATITSGFWLALVTGRVLMTLMPSRVHEQKIVLFASVAAAIALLVALFYDSAEVDCILTGLERMHSDHFG